jgi:hypothetical protein
MTLIRPGIAAVLMLTASATFATERFHTSTIKIVYPVSGGDFVIGFDTEVSTCTSTASPKQLYVAVGQNGVTATGSAKMFAAALAALYARGIVTIAFDDATTACYINRIQVGI